MVITSPVGPYYKTGFSAVNLLAEETYVRAWPGGTGCYKIGGNYAPGIIPQMKAAAQNFQQILWLFGNDHYLTEVGTMNCFVFWINENGGIVDLLNQFKCYRKRINYTPIGWMHSSRSDT